jgi:hypothetical protein
MASFSFEDKKEIFSTIASLFMTKEGNCEEISEFVQNILSNFGVN